MIRAGLIGIGIVAFATPALASGGDGGGLFFPILNLVILIAVLAYFGRKPVLDFFNTRRGQVQDDLHSAAELRREAETRFAKWQRKLVDLGQELEQIRTTSRERAEAEREQIITDANAAAERIRSDATAAIDQELRRSRDLLREEAADLAIELAGNLLRDQVTDVDRERLVIEFIERIERTPASDGRGSGR
jgi:F-type H+-transporting ATPase subunit b